MDAAAISKKQQTAEALREKAAVKERQLKEIKERLRRIEIQERTARVKQERRDDSRRKILAGAFLLAKAEEAGSEPIIIDFQRDIDAYLLRSDDRKLFGLAPLTEQNKAPVAPLILSQPLQRIAEAGKPAATMTFESIAAQVVATDKQ